MRKYRQTYRDIGKASLVIIFITIIDKIFAVVKEIIVADRFGISSDLDAFNIALTLPGLVGLLFSAALIGAFVPLYLEWRSQSTARQANTEVLAMIFLATIFFGFLTIIFYLSAPYIYPLLGFGFENEVKTLGVTIEKAMVFLILIDGAGILLAGLLHAQKHFLHLQTAPVFINVSIIILLIFFHNRLGVFAMVWGFILGTACKVFYMAFVLRRDGFSFWEKPKFNRANLTAFVLLALPLLGSELISNANLVIDQIMATMLSAGSVSTLRYAYRVNDMPIQVVIMALTVAIFPFISQQALEKDFQGMGELFKQSVIFVAFLTLPIICMILIFSEEVVGILFQRGAFDREATIQTAKTLLFYSAGLFFLAYSFINGAFFSALKDTKPLFYMGCLSIFLNIFLNIIFMNLWQVAGIALSTTFSLGVIATIFMFLLKRRIDIDFPKIGNNFIRLGAASICMLVAGWVLKYYMAGAGIDKLIYLPLIVLAVSLGYLAICWILRTEEMTLYLDILKQR